VSSTLKSLETFSVHKKKIYCTYQQLEIQMLDQLKYVFHLIQYQELNQQKNRTELQIVLMNNIEKNRSTQCIYHFQLVRHQWARE
jgi:hypothetical protein